MNRTKQLSYPWRWQIVCLVLAVGGSVGYVLTLPVDVGFHFSTPVFKMAVSYFLLFILVMVFVAIMPVLSFRRRRKALHETASVCGRCEKELPPGSTIARFGNEFLCEECTKHMEGIQGEELPKFNKPEGM